MQYYFQTQCGRALLGTPVFDGTGQWITLIGQGPTAQGVCHLVPPHAVTAMLERAHEWR